MTEQHELTPLVRAWLGRSLDSLPAPTHRYPAVAAEVNARPQERSWQPRVQRPSGRGLVRATTFVTAAVVVVGLGGLAVTSILQAPRQQAAVTGVEVAPTPVASQQPTSTPSPQATQAARPDDPRLAATGPWLRWEPATSPIDIPVAAPLRRDDGISVREVSGGGITVTWQEGRSNKADDGYRPLRITVRESDGSTTESMIDAAQHITSVAIGPPGVVITTHTGPWLSRYKRLDKAGLARIGLTPQDRRGATRTWVSRDGADWTLLPEFTEAYAQARAIWTLDGYFLRHSADDEQDAAARLWHSKDGQSWKRAGTDRHYSDLHAWNGQALLVGERFFGLATPSGVKVLPVTGEVFREDGPFKTTPRVAGSGRPKWWKTAAGPTGLLTVHWEKGIAMFSPDGETWSIAPIPAQWVGCGNVPTKCKPSAFVMQDGVVRVDAWVREGDTSDPGRSRQQWVGTPVASDGE